MELLIMAREKLWVEGESIEEVVIIDGGGEISLREGTRPHLRVLKRCLLYCCTCSGASTWCELSNGILSLSANGRVLITTARADVFSTSSESGWRSVPS